ncbi:MAG: arginase [Candidatus Devosia phytovorans]|uniref:Arginase n=1 Tax=Candidatus Devosia phytovorans TaxID=3121372 RepID=A0AAJ5VY56_9HYPH|nr:arginase [Devosia sp.]WEK06151.1 MAG: arginase [Devosia sp.]
MTKPRRIDLIGIATAAGASVRGCGMGPEALRVAGLAEALIELEHEVVDHGDLRRPQPPLGTSPASQRLPDERRADVLDLAARISDQGFSILKDGHFPVFLGGDHSIAMGTVSAVARHCEAAKKPVFVLWIDAHADFNTPATSPSGNLHGMPLALLCGEPGFDDEYQGEWLGPISPKRVTIIGARSVDREERKLLNARGVEVLDMRRIDETGVVALMRNVLARVKEAGGHLHVSLDVDAMDPSIAPGGGTLVPGGLSYREAHLIMEMLHDSGLVGSLDVVELNPFLDHGGTSATLLVDLVASLFGRSVMGEEAGPVEFVTEDDLP